MLKTRPNGSRTRTARHSPAKGAQPPAPQNDNPRRRGGAPLSPHIAYNRAAQFYDERTWMRFWELNEKPRVLGILEELNGAAILDVGCGTGFYLLDLVRAGHTAWGIDASAAMLARLREKLGQLTVADRARVTTACGDAGSAQLPENFFDAGIIIRTLSHIADLAPVLKILKHSIRKGGTLILADLHWKHSYSCTILKDARTAHVIPVKTFKRSPKTYRREIERFGFRQVSTNSFSFLDCEWGGLAAREFEAEAQRPTNPIFFISRFTKTA